MQNFLPQKPNFTTGYQQNEIESHYSKEGIVILQPLVVRIPNSRGVYFPSKLKPQREISYEEFLKRYADYPRRLLVCFDESPSFSMILRRSELVTAYSFGLDCWYMVTSFNLYG